MMAARVEAADLEERAAARRRTWLRFRRARLLWLGTALLVFAVLAAFLGPVLFNLHPYRMDVAHILQPPSALYPMGTDEYGRSVLARVLFGTRLSLFVGVAVALITLGLGTTLGLVAAYFPSGDSAVMRVMDALMAFPSILLALALMSVIGPGTLNSVVVLAVVYLPATTRVVRATSKVALRLGYVEAAQALGASRLRVLVRHVLPGIMGPLLVQQTFILAYAILGEATLSFVGAGTPPPTPSLGNILSEAKSVIYEAGWLALYPGLAIAWLVLGVNLLGDGLRDALSVGSRS